MGPAVIGVPVRGATVGGRVRDPIRPLNAAQTRRVRDVLVAMGLLAEKAPGRTHLSCQRGSRDLGFTIQSRTSGSTQRL